jgi:hypothetical protein
MKFGRRAANLSMAARAFDRILNIHKLRGIKSFKQTPPPVEDPDLDTKAELVLKFTQPQAAPKSRPKQLSMRKSAFDLQLSREARELSLSRPTRYPPPGAYEPRRYNTRLTFQMRRSERFGSMSSTLSHAISQVATEADQTRAEPQRRRPATASLLKT